VDWIVTAARKRRRSGGRRTREREVMVECTAVAVREEGVLAAVTSGVGWQSSPWGEGNAEVRGGVIMVMVTSASVARRKRREKEAMVECMAVAVREEGVLAAVTSRVGWQSSPWGEGNAEVRGGVIMVMVTSASVARNGSGGGTRPGGPPKLLAAG
jgi:hypothetical protein